MTFKVAVIYFSRRGRLVTLANVIAEGAKKVPGAEVNVYRIKDPVLGDTDDYEEGVLDAPIATVEDVLEADALIMGAPGRQGGMSSEMRFFLDSLGPLQQQVLSGNSYGALKGKVGSAFTSVGGNGRGYGGHEAILQSFHSTFLQHGMVVVGNPPHPCMDDTLNATPFGVVMGGKQESAGPLIHKDEVRLAYAMGEWTAQVARLLHDSDLA